MRYLLIFMIIGSFLQAENFTLASETLKGQISKAQEFNGFGCSGQNISPELHWSNPPKGTKSFALTVYDPDAPTGSGWWHWMVVNIPLATVKMAEGASTTGKLPQGAMETMTDYGTSGFGGACPPKGDKAHAYIFTVHALDTDTLEVNEKSDSALVGYMINSHTIQKATIVSYYQREK